MSDSCVHTFGMRILKKNYQNNFAKWPEKIPNKSVNLFCSQLSCNT